jgi:hypothetical protein
MPGACRTRGLACKVKKAHKRSHHGYSRIHPAFPHAMVLTAYIALSPVTGLFCHRRQRIKALSARSGSQNLRKLDASVGASGPHDFAVREPAPFVDAPVVAHGKPPCDPARASAGASTASRSASVTIAIRPSVGRDGKRYTTDLGQVKSEISEIPKEIVSEIGV